MSTDINSLSNKFNNLQIVPYKKPKTYDIDSIIISIKNIKIGKKKLKIYRKYKLLNRKLYMDEIFGQALMKYNMKYKPIKMISYNNNYDADNDE